MNSIDDLRRRAAELVRDLRYRWLWHRRVRPAAERLGPGRELDPPRSDAEETWYTPVGTGRSNFVRLEIDDIGPALTAEWRSRGRDELVGVADSVVGLVVASQAEEEAAAEVSSEVYAMY